MKNKNKILDKNNKNIPTIENNIIKNTKTKIFFGEKNPNYQKNFLLGDNRIITTKYNLLSFFPKSLFFQFKKAANIYFLIISIITCMKFSPKQPSSIIGTFAFVLLATQIKEAIEDYSRYKQDKISNNKIVLKFSENSWIPVKCCSLFPGDIVKILKEEEIFADCLIIKSSNSSGYCFVDTKNLDGETNLKDKCSVEEFKNLHEKKFQNFFGFIDSDKPNEFINIWEGIVSYEKLSIYTCLKNLILKGSVLKNTDFVIGILIYTGKDTKIMKNSKQHSTKTSRILLTMNKLLYSLFIFDIILCLVFSLLSFLWFQNNFTTHLYIFPKQPDVNIITQENNNKPNSQLGENFFILFLTFFVTFSQIIPISLYVALEIIKIFQGILIYYDNDLYDKVLKKPTISRTTDLIEELGQVEFIFSDKTGTLTENNMVLKKCYVNKKIYGIIKEKNEDAKYTMNGDISITKKLLSLEQDDKLDREELLNFFYLLTLCHSVFPEKTDRGIIYQGSSPDDVALVEGAKQIGIEFKSKEFNNLIINNNLTNEKIIWEQKVEMPFDSDRKRMSVIVKNKITNEIFLLTKGADNIMLSDNRIIYNSEIYEDLDKVLNIFSKEGLRTLIMGTKILNIVDYTEWEDRYNQARVSGRDLNPFYNEMEKDMNFAGISAVEDKLQDGVPETIHTLINCNIKFFMLTGDKQDTAIEIAKSCRLINENMQVIILSTDPEKVDDRLREIIVELKLNYLIRDIDLQSISENMRENFENDLSIVVNGSTLDIVLNNAEYAKMFLCISVAAKSVICCRVSPKQKARVVKLIKDSGKWVTLSIGDGANDVPMIMEAHLGIGIQGKEGTQAVRSADYAIGQFKFLEKLLLYHGRNGYVKISKFICYYFYKNIFLVFVELFFSFYSGFSGQIFLADYLSTMYNAFFTSWPCLFTFGLEKSFDLKICKKFPILYKAGQINYYFNMKVFWKYVIFAIIHSLLVFYIPIMSMNGIINSKGEIFSCWQISTLSFSLIINVTTIKLLVISDFWNIINLSACVLSIGFYYLTLGVMSTEVLAKRLQNEILGVLLDLVFNFKSLGILLFAPVICVLPDITIKQFFMNVYPTPGEYIEKYGDSSEYESIINSDSNFVKSISNLYNDPSQKIKIININQEIKMEVSNKKNLFLINNTNNKENINETSKIPLKLMDSIPNMNFNNLNNLDEINKVHIHQNFKELNIFKK